ncbi:MAG: ABC transporter permease [Acidimicrobiales bacterium]
MTAVDSPPAVSSAPPQEPRLRSLLRLYSTLIRLSVISEIQYRAATYFYMFGMITEPVIYLVVWSSIAESNGGEVGGFTPQAFAAYYIVWTLVRNMNIVFTPFGWEERIREGQLSAQLARPLHPIHYDIGSFAGWKIVVIVLWIPLAFVLSLIFKPDIDPRLSQVLVFSVAIWGAYLIRTLMLWMLGMVTFWTTRIGAAFQMFFAVELLLSGRLVPMTLMPDWVQQLAAVLPFESTFGFPIIALVGPITNAELLQGLVTQAIWIAVGSVGVALMWRRAVARYTAVSG